MCGEGEKGREKVRGGGGRRGEGREKVRGGGGREGREKVRGGNCVMDTERRREEKERGEGEKGREKVRGGEGREGTVVGDGRQDDGRCTAYEDPLTISLLCLDERNGLTSTKQ